MVILRLLTFLSYILCYTGLWCSHIICDQKLKTRKDFNGEKYPCECRDRHNPERPKTSTNREKELHLKGCVADCLRMENKMLRNHRAVHRKPREMIDDGYENLRGWMPDRHKNCFEDFRILVRELTLLQEEIRLKKEKIAELEEIIKQKDEIMETNEKVLRRLQYKLKDAESSDYEKTYNYTKNIYERNEFSEDIVSENAVSINVLKRPDPNQSEAVAINYNDRVIPNIPYPYQKPFPKGSLLEVWLNMENSDLDYVRKTRPYTVTSLSRKESPEGGNISYISSVYKYISSIDDADSLYGILPDESDFPSGSVSRIKDRPENSPRLIQSDIDWYHGDIYFSISFGPFLKQMDVEANENYN
ncbi:hypothetical protein SK128_004504 [Halocaridina rubra]|uniref:Uncharacterized protein n=1 Tax=Halocaridina rubra TaxID=373956 RepID=A0AAN8X2N0_HALRR